MSETSALKLTQLRLRLLSAIEEDKRARRGSDKTYKRECKAELANLRTLIGNILFDEREKVTKLMGGKYE